ncbi:hypothetical protein [Chitinophaga sp. HK235]|uniref:hypothetical protein n=1 Tax=Chitinophaga sp. HK235 TaxID=2952571 RepID=UPI001BA8DAAA|nr:hypothetical protein [Chitinophaga sp. HK235]
MWDKITVRKYQELYGIISADDFEHEIDRSIHLLSCLFDKPVEHYESMPMPELKQETKRLAFLDTKDLPVSAAPRYFTVNGRRYQPLYDFRNLVAGQFIDAITCAKEPGEFISNLHRMLAAISRPTKRTWRGRKVLPYGATPFDQVAEDMLDLPIVQANAAAVFFCKLWSSFLTGMPAYLEQKGEMMPKESLDMWTQVMEAAGDGL